MNDEQNQNNSSVVFEQGKRFAKRAAGKLFKKAAKKFAKKAISFAVKLLGLVLKKLIIVLVGFLGIPLAIALGVAVIAGSVVYLAFSFGWITDSNVDKEQLMNRYKETSALTAENPDFRAPVWLLQVIDNVSILKDGREPEEIDPERISLGLEAEITEETKRNSTASWTGTGTKTMKYSDVTLTTEVHTWNRVITYEYKQLTDQKHVYSSEVIYGSKEAGGMKTNSSGTNLHHWENTSIETISHSGGMVKQYLYTRYTDRNSSTVSTPLKSIDDESIKGRITTQSSNTKWILTGSNKNRKYLGENEVKDTESYTYSSQSSSNSQSYETDLSSFSQSYSTAYNKYDETTEWVISKITEVVDYSKLTSRLLELGFTVSDFDIVREAVLEQDPTNVFVRQYNPSLLHPDDTEMLWNGGVIPNSSQVIVGSNDWAYPTTLDSVVSSNYGYRKGKLHKGLDIARSDKSKDYPIYSVYDGTVTWAGYRDNGYGYYVIVDHGNDVSTLYAHMKAGSLQVKTGGKVVRGQAVGVMGTTGDSTGIHLHFEVKVKGEFVNPLLYIRK